MGGDGTMSQRRAIEIVLNMAMVCALVAAGVLLAYLSTLLNTHTQYLAFLPSIVLCSRFYDFACALMAEILSTLALWDWFVPPEGFALPSTDEIGHLLGFVLITSFLCWVVRRDRRSQAELARENFELGYRVSYLLRTLQGLGAAR
jgi:K+-sensing histidine kinase KdpD